MRSWGYFIILLYRSVREAKKKIPSFVTNFLLYHGPYFLLNFLQSALICLEGNSVLHSSPSPLQLHMSTWQPTCVFTKYWLANQTPLQHMGITYRNIGTRSLKIRPRMFVMDPKPCVVQWLLWWNSSDPPGKYQRRSSLSITFRVYLQLIILSKISQSDLVWKFFS